MMYDYKLHLKSEPHRLTCESSQKMLISQKNKGNIVPIVEYNNSGIFSDFIRSLSEEELNKSFIEVYEKFLKTTKE